MKTSVVGLIPIKRSKRLKNKNLRKIGNKSLVELLLVQARKSKLKNRVYVSSNADELLKEAERHGALLVDRPDRLAQDDTNAIEVLKHFCRVIAADYYVLMQVTYFPWHYSIIDGCIDSMVNSDADLVISVNRVTAKDRKLFWYQEDDYIEPWFSPWLQGEEFERKILLENGACYVFRRESISDAVTLNDFKKVIPYVCNNTFVDIDYKEDLLEARKLYRSMSDE